MFLCLLYYFLYFTISCSRWRTRIVLPLKSDANSLSSGDMMSRFQDIQPSLLLFLNRLRCIVIEDMVRERETERRQRQRETERQTERQRETERRGRDRESARNRERRAICVFIF